MSNFLNKYSSAIHTFLGTFITTILATLALVNPNDLLSAKYWTITVVLSIVSAGVRAGVKAVSPLSA